MGPIMRKSLIFLLTVLFLLPTVVCLGDDAEEMTPEEKKEHQKAVKLVLHKLKTERNKVVVLAHIERLGSEGEKVGRDALIAFVKGNKNQQQLDGAFRALAKIGGKVSVEFLCGKLALNSRNFLVQHSAAVALGSAGDPRAVGPLLAVMTKKTTKIFVIGACAGALAQSYPDDEGAVKALFKLTHHRKDMIRSYALSAIGHLGTDEAVERLKEALFKDSNSGAKTYAATGLGNTGRRDVIPILKEAMAKSNSLQVKTACSAAINIILNPE